MNVGKEVICRIRFRIWNIGTLKGRSMEIVDTRISRRINLICLQEIKWLSEKVNELDKSRFKLWYTEKFRSKNRVGIIVDKDSFNVISGYTSQVRLAKHLKVKFWEDL